MPKLVLIVLYCLTFPALVQAQQEPITAQDAWIREAPANAKTMAGYLVLHNNSSRTYTLTCAKSKHFRSIEFHRTVIKNGTASMHQFETLAIPAKGTLALQPGNFHFMLIGPRIGLNAGDELMITLCITHEGKQEEHDIVMTVKRP